MHIMLFLMVKEIMYFLSCFYISISFLVFFFTICWISYFTFLLSDGIYGSTFFMTTGFHAFHVIIDLLFWQFAFSDYLSLQLLIMLFRSCDLVLAFCRRCLVFLWLSVYGGQAYNNFLAGYLFREGSRKKKNKKWKTYITANILL